MEIVNGTEITYLYAQGQPFALHKNNSETEAINYLHLDYQGSIMAITNQNGTLLEERNYDVWGRPRTANTLEYILPNPFGNGSVVKRGYTFHEHLEEFNIINMNGRIYDPVLARFLNADPLLQDNTNGQNYNRYSYVLNNPTKYTDPSGYAYSGFTASNDNIGASSTSFISDATAKIEEDYKGSKARDASSDEKFGSGGSDPGVNDPVDGDPTKPTTSGVKNTSKTCGNYGVYKYQQLNKLRPDADGVLTYFEANAWRRWGDGQPLYIDFNKISLGSFKMSDFDKSKTTVENNPSLLIKFDGKNYVNKNQALVYGTITLVKIGSDKVMIMPDNYNFDFKFVKGSIARDTGTLLGLYLTPSGKPFPIYFYNSIRTIR